MVWAYKVKDMCQMEWDFKSKGVGSQDHSKNPIREKVMILESLEKNMKKFDFLTQKYLGFP